MVTRQPPYHRDRRRVYLVFINIFVYAFFIQWFCSNIKIDALTSGLSQVSIAGVFISLCVYIVALLLYGKRMAALLGVHFSAGFNIVNMGYAANLILPLRLGDALKIVWAHRLGIVSINDLVASSLVEKFLDICKLTILGLIVSILAVDRFHQSGLNSIVPLLVLTLIVLLVCAGLFFFMLLNNQSCEN
jgi:hypothetical protein